MFKYFYHFINMPPIDGDRGVVNIGRSQISVIVGYIYEWGFKLGFLNGKVNDYESFKKGIFISLRQRICDKVDSEICERLLDILNDVLRYISHISENILIAFKTLLITSRELGSTKNELEWLVRFAATLGYVLGRLLGDDYQKINWIKYDIGETYEVSYKNADLLFISGSELVVVDIKSYGLYSFLKGMKSGGAPLPPDISSYNITFSNLVHTLVECSDKVSKANKVRIDIRSLYQVATYAADYLSENCRQQSQSVCVLDGNKKVDKVTLVLIYPMDRYRQPLPIGDLGEIRNNLEKLKNIYKMLKGKHVSIDVGDLTSAEIIRGLEKRIGKPSDKDSTEPVDKDGNQRIVIQNIDLMLQPTTSYNTFLDALQIQLMVKMYEKGMTLEEVAKVLDVSSATVRRYLKRAGVQLRRGTRPKRPTVTCPKCAQTGRLHIAELGTKTHVYVKHPIAVGRYKYCYLGVLEKIEKQYPDISKTLQI